MSTTCPATVEQARERGLVESIRIRVAGTPSLYLTAHNVRCSACPRQFTDEDPTLAFVRMSVHYDLECWDGLTEPESPPCACCGDPIEEGTEPVRLNPREVARLCAPCSGLAEDGKLDLGFLLEERVDEE